MKKIIHVILVLFPFITLANDDYRPIRESERWEEDKNRRIYGSPLLGDLNKYNGTWRWFVDPNSGCYVWNFLSSSANEDETIIKWQGGCEDNQATGKGVVELYVKGVLIDRYEGYMKEGKREGMGVSSYEGTRYEGNWKDSKKHGKGVVFLKNGSREEGEWKDNKENGEMTFITSDGKVTKQVIRMGWEMMDFQLEEEAEAALKTEQKAKKQAEEIDALQRRNQRIRDEISTLKKKAQ